MMEISELTELSSIICWTSSILVSSVPLLPLMIVLMENINAILPATRIIKYSMAENITNLFFKLDSYLPPGFFSLGILIPFAIVKA
jgi:hypothetical protein